MSHNIYNLKHPHATGFVKIANSGKEKFGTVIRHGKMDKTVTVSRAIQEDGLSLSVNSLPNLS